MSKDFLIPNIFVSLFHIRDAVSKESPIYVMCPLLLIIMSSHKLEFLTSVRTAMDAISFFGLFRTKLR